MPDPGDLRLEGMAQAVLNGLPRAYAPLTAKTPAQTQLGAIMRRGLNEIGQAAAEYLGLLTIIFVAVFIAFFVGTHFRWRQLLAALPLIGGAASFFAVFWSIAAYRRQRKDAVAMIEEQTNRHEDVRRREQGPG